MKKLFVLSCVALATLASCSKSEDIEAPQAQKEIAFSVATDKSRAPIEGTSFADAQKIYVSAYNSVSGNYFSGVAFSKKDGDTWKAGKYWPVNGVTSFLAYAATGDVTATWGDDKYANKVEFTLNDGFYNSSESGTTPYIDLLYASGEQKKEKDYTPVSMTFKHTGAWVLFNVKLASDLTDSKVTLNSFQLANLFNGGKVVVDNTTYAGAKASWVFSGDAADYDVESFTAKDLSTTDYTFGAIIPEQNQTAIKFNYTLSSTASTGAAFDAQTVNFEYPLSRFDKWEMGKKYVYNITITFKEIEIKPSVTDWGDPTDTAIGI